MSKLRKYRRGLQIDRLKVARAMVKMVQVAGSYEKVKENFPQVFEQTFAQKTVEVFEPASAGVASATEGATP